jgi:hypothetical protein
MASTHLLPILAAMFIANVVNAGASESGWPLLGAAAAACGLRPLHFQLVGSVAVAWRRVVIGSRLWTRCGVAASCAAPDQWPRRRR